MEPVNGHDSLDHGKTQFNVQPGVRLNNRYTLTRELGRGAMGIVYLAHDGQLDVDVAVKVLPPELDQDPRSVKRLKNEAKLSMSLAHDNIVRLHNFEETDSLRYLIMEYVDGPDLLHVLADRDDERIPINEFLPLADAICAGVAYAHTKNIVHSDLKPSNIMLTTTGEVKVADFGIAQIVKETMTRVTNVETSGTLLYMAPELHEGHRARPPSDQYALGCTFYELLTGEPPFARGNVTFQHLSREPDPIDGVPDHVNTAILKALAKKPEDRWESVEEFAKALRGEDASAFSGENAVAGDSGRDAEIGVGVAPRGDPKEKTNKEPGDHGGIAGSAPRTRSPLRDTPEPVRQTRVWHAKPLLVGTLAIVIIAVAGWWFTQNTEEPPAPPPQPVKPTAFGNLYISSTPPGAIVWIGGKSRGITPCMIDSVPVGQIPVRLLFTDSSDVDITATIRKDEFTRLENVVIPRSTTRVNIASNPLDADLTWDGKPAGKTPITVRGVTTGRHTATLIKQNYVQFDTSFHVPTGGLSAMLRMESGGVFFRGKWVRKAYEQSILNAEANDTQKKKLSNLRNRIKRALSRRDWSSAERTTAMLSKMRVSTSSYAARIARGRAEDAETARLEREARETREAETRTKKITETISTLRSRWQIGDRSGRDRALTNLRRLDSGNSMIRKYSGPIPGQLIHTLQGHTNYVNSVSVSGDYIVSGSDDNTVKVWRLSTGELVRTLYGHNNGVQTVYISGGYIASGSYKEIRVWRLSTGEPVRTLSGHRSGVQTVYISGDYIVSGSNDNTIKVWQLSTGRHLHTLIGHTGCVRSVFISRDYIVSGSDDGTIKVWRLSTGSRIGTWVGDKFYLWSVFVSGDYIVSGGAENIIRVWEISTGKLVGSLRGHTEPVLSVCASKDYIVSGSNDATIKVWRLSTNELIHTIFGHTTAVISVAVSGDYIVSGSDKTVKVWRKPW
jgi:serine/threonine protein kinase